MKQTEGILVLRCYLDDYNIIVTLRTDNSDRAKWNDLSNKATRKKIVDAIIKILNGVKFCYYRKLMDVIAKKSFVEGKEYRSNQLLKLLNNID